MGVEPWMGQLGIAGILAVLLLVLGRTWIASVDRRVAERDAEHQRELERITKQHERELTDMRERADAWRVTADRREAALAEALTLNATLAAGNDTAVHLLRAIHGQAQARELETG